MPRPPYRLRRKFLDFSQKNCSATQASALETWIDSGKLRRVTFLKADKNKREKEYMDLNSAFWGEFFGTLVLITLGNGVVAGALLSRSKAQNAGWISITAGWGLAVFAGVAVAIALGDS